MGEMVRKSSTRDSKSRVALQLREGFVGLEVRVARRQTSRYSG